MSEESHSPERTSGPEVKLDEFGLIHKFFVDSSNFPGVWPSTPIGDDCAVLDIGNTKLAVTADMMAIGTHFLEGADPYTVGRKALAVNLSDLAAAGASPQAFFLSIALPEVNTQWLERFSKGLMEEARLYHCPLRGGDTTKSASVDGKPGKTCISICALGEIPERQPLTRSGAKVGDDIWVTGTPGDAFAYLGSVWHEFAIPESSVPYFKLRMDIPVPRVEVGQKIRPFATACCDISDGLIGDLRHILERSQVSAVLYWKDFPRSRAMAELPDAVQQRCILGGGDDYELLFTAPASYREEIRKISEELEVPITRIGEIRSKDLPFECIGEAGNQVTLPKSFNHFA